MLGGRWPSVTPDRSQPHRRCRQTASLETRALPRAGSFIGATKPAEGFGVATQPPSSPRRGWVDCGSSAVSAVETGMWPTAAIAPKAPPKFPSGQPHISPADPYGGAIRLAPSLSRMPTLVRHAASSALETEFEDLESSRSRGSQRAGPRSSVTPNRQVPPNWSYQRRLVPV